MASVTFEFNLADVSKYGHFQSFHQNYTYQISKYQNIKILTFLQILYYKPAAKLFASSTEICRLLDKSDLVPTKTLCILFLNILKYFEIF